MAVSNIPMTRQFENILMLRISTVSNTNVVITLPEGSSVDGYIEYGLRSTPVALAVHIYRDASGTIAECGIRNLASGTDVTPSISGGAVSINIGQWTAGFLALTYTPNKMPTISYSA